MDPSYYFTDYGDEIDNAVEEGRRGRFWKRFATFVTILVVLAAIALVVARRYTAPIDVAKVTPDKAVAWLVLRDLTEESPETREKLYDLYIGSVSNPDPENAKKVEFSLPEPIKKFSGLILAGRDDKVSEWKTKSERPSYLRIDYLYAPSNEPQERLALSTDVKPGPALLQRWQKRRDELEQAPKKRSTVDKNVQFIIFQWFVTKCKEYDATPDDKKKDKLNADVDELLSLQDFYNNMREAAKKPRLTKTQALREFEMTLEAWIDFVEPDELARVYWFKDVLEVGAVRQLAGGDPDALYRFASYPPVYPRAQDAPKDAERDEKQSSRDELRATLEQARDKARRYLFGK